MGMGTAEGLLGGGAFVVVMLPAMHMHTASPTRVAQIGESGNVCVGGVWGGAGGGRVTLAGLCVCVCVDKLYTAC